MSQAKTFTPQDTHQIRKKLYQIMKYTIKLSELIEMPCEEYLAEFVNGEIDILESFKKLGQQFYWLLRCETKGFKSDEDSF